MTIPLCRPYLTDELRREVLGVLDSGHLTEGAATRELEALVAEASGSRYGIAVTSCTVGLETALRNLGVGPGDEVIVPDYTFPATAQAVLAVGALPVIVDIDPETMLMDMDACEKAVTPKTKAVIPVSLFGNPLNGQQLESLRERHRIFIVEDAACALGGSHNGRPSGRVADVAVFSFHPRKLITTGEGGMIVTDDVDLADLMRSYLHFGQDMNAAVARESVSFVRQGTNGKLSSLQAILGVVQMRHFPEIKAVRERRAARYTALLADVDGVELPKVTEGGEHAWQSFCVFVNERDRVLHAMREQGVEVQIGTYSLSAHAYFRDACRCVGQLDNSRQVFDSCLALPLYHDMTDEEQDRVVAVLAETTAGAVEKGR